MLVKENVRLRKLIGGTWRIAFTIVLVCTLSSILNQFFVKDYLEFPTMLAAVLGTMLALFIGFENNQLYGRWWEARTIIGSMSTECKTMARQCLNYIPDKTASKEMVYTQIAFAYAVKEYLTNSNEKRYNLYLRDKSLESLATTRSMPAAILSLQTQNLEDLYGRGHIDGFKFLQLNQTLNNIAGETGKAERIKTTVFPTVYTFYTKLFIWIFILSATMALNNAVGLYSILFGSVVGYVYYASYLIGQTLLNPFDPKPTGLPLGQITRNLEIALKEMLGEKDLPDPVASVNEEYVL